MKKRELLYIEDNFHNRRIVRKILERQGFQLYEAEDGLIGFNLIKDMKPVLVLLDISLPGMDGIEIAQRVKADPDLNHIFLIALTASAMQGDRERFLEAGCDDYMSKPFKALELAQMVTKHFEALESRQAFLDSIDDVQPETYVPAWDVPRRPVDIDTARPGEREPESASHSPEAQEDQLPVEQDPPEFPRSQFETKVESIEIPDGIAAGESVEPDAEKEDIDTDHYIHSNDLDTTSLDPAMLAQESTAAAPNTFDPAELSDDSLKPSEELSPPSFMRTPENIEQPLVEETPPAVEETYPVVEETQPVVEETTPAVEETFPVVEDHHAQPVFPGESETAESPPIQETPVEPPIDSEVDPAVSEADPVVSEADPVVSEADPVVSEADQVASEADPAVSEVDPVASEADPAAIEQGLRDAEDEPFVWLPETEVSSAGEQIKSEAPEEGIFRGENLRSTVEEEVKFSEETAHLDPIQESANEWAALPVDEVSHESSEPAPIDAVETEREDLSTQLVEQQKESFTKIHTAPLDEKLAEKVTENSHAGGSVDEGEVINLSRNQRNKQIAANILGMINPETIRPVDPNVGDDEI